MYSENLSFESDFSSLSPPDFHDQYVDVALLGKGSFGTVTLARDIFGKTFAKKKIYLDSEEEGLSTAVLREISILLELKHKNIVRLLKLNYCWKSKHFV